MGVKIRLNGKTYDTDINVLDVNSEYVVNINGQRVLINVRLEGLEVGSQHELDEFKKGEIQQEETPEQIMNELKQLLLQKFKEAGVEKYDYTSPLTGIRLYYDGKEVSITYNGKDATEILATNRVVNVAFSHYLQALVAELERKARGRSKGMSQYESKKGEAQQEVTPEQIMNELKQILLQKFKEAGIEKYDYTSPLTGIRIYYDGEKVEITYNGEDATKILTTNRFVSVMFSNFIQSKVAELERLARERANKK